MRIVATTPDAAVPLVARVPSHHDRLRSCGADHAARLPLAAGLAGQEAALSRALGFFHDNLGEPVSVEDLARTAGLESGRFSRLFKRRVGLAPRSYLTQVRFERAKELIRGSDKNLTQIAAEAGFTDQSHMTNVFRRLTGMTPKVFRGA